MQSDRRLVLVTLTLAALTFAWVFLLSVRQWRPELENLQTAFWLIPPLTIFPFVAGVILGRWLEPRELLPRTQKTLVALATAGVAAAHFSIGTLIEMPAEDPERTLFFWGGLIMFGGLGGILAYGLAGAGSHSAKARNG